MRRNILITGGTGQVGRRLVLSLLDCGDTVLVVSRDLSRVHQLFGEKVIGIQGDPTTSGNGRKPLTARMPSFIWQERALLTTVGILP